MRNCSACVLRWIEKRPRDLFASRETGYRRMLVVPMRHTIVIPLFLLREAGGIGGSRMSYRSAPTNASILHDGLISDLKVRRLQFGLEVAEMG